MLRRILAWPVASAAPLSPGWASQQTGGGMPPLVIAVCVAACLSARVRLGGALASGPPRGGVAVCSPPLGGQTRPLGGLWSFDLDHGLRVAEAMEMPVALDALSGTSGMPAAAPARQCDPQGCRCGCHRCTRRRCVADGRGAPCLRARARASEITPMWRCEHLEQRPPGGRSRLSSRSAETDQCEEREVPISCEV